MQDETGDAKHAVRKLNAYTIYLFHGSGSALFAVTAYTMLAYYYFDVVGLSAFQLVLVGTALEISAFLFETPTGVVADVYSRRWSVIVGTFLMGLGFILEGSIPLFVAILLAQVVKGAGYTFISGAREAWIADELGEEKAGDAYVRLAQFAQVGALVGIVASTGLARVRLNLPPIVGGGLFVGLSAFLVIAMPEYGFKRLPQENRTSWQNMMLTLRDGVRVVRRRSVLMMILCIGIFFGLHSEGFDRLWEAHFLQNFVFPTFRDFGPEFWFGGINIGSNLIGILVTEVVQRRVNLTRHASIVRSLIILNLFQVASLILFGLAGNFPLAIAAYWSVRGLRTAGSPIFTAWINQHVDSKVRATVFSISSQADALGQMVGGPIVGAIGSLKSIRWAMVASGLLLSPVLGLLGRLVWQPERTDR
jgi:MFS transporter, DHA3 family, tetracycline resistance protein